VRARARTLGGRVDLAVAQAAQSIRGAILGSGPRDKEGDEEEREEELDPSPAPPRT
jgi:hypothetical protein